MDTARFTLFVLSSLCCLSSVAQQPDSNTALNAQVQAALLSDIRTERERARDANRKPSETLSFFGLNAEMTVLELVPAGGWYTKILAPILKVRGKLYVALGTAAVEQLAATHEQLNAIVPLTSGADLTRTDWERADTLEDTLFGINDVDMVLTFRNLHNFPPRNRALMHRATFEALKPGGVYGVVDHTRRHMEPRTRENGRRVDPVVAIEEIIAAGFRFDGFTDLHYRPVDELSYEVGHRDVTGRTDRFTLRFVKPMSD